MFILSQRKAQIRNPKNLDLVLIECGFFCLFLDFSKEIQNPFLYLDFPKEMHPIFLPFYLEIRENEAPANVKRCFSVHLRLCMVLESFRSSLALKL